MTIRFAAAHTGESTAIVRALTSVTLQGAANDNGAVFPRDEALRAALKHFAEYGLGAAQKAYANAERAFFAGHREEYRHWLGICRALDRRMADAIVAHHGTAGKV